VAHTHHHHVHDSWEDAPLRSPVRRLLTAIVVVVGVATVIGLVVWWPSGEAHVDEAAVDFGHRVDATVTSAQRAACTYDPARDCAQVTFEITSGDNTGSLGSIETDTSSQTPASKLSDGDEIVVVDAGPDVDAASRYAFADIRRGQPLLLLALLFAAAVVALGRLKGLLALVGIVVSLGVLLVFVFPALLQGENPVAVALTGSALIAFVTLYLAHGPSTHTTVALVGTLISLGLAGFLGTVFAGAASLSGLASEESTTLLAFAPDLDFRGLLLAAVIIGALGVLDDVTITQASAVWELHRADPDASARSLFAAGTRIGRDHIASTVNTLVLAYAAAALPLLLLYTQSTLGVGDVLSSETVAVEIVQTLVGSIGLVAAVPLTTALAAWAVTQGQNRHGASPGSVPGRARPERPTGVPARRSGGELDRREGPHRGDAGW
jgi:uncharacterized membrane protein